MVRENTRFRSLHFNKDMAWTEEDRPCNNATCGNTGSVNTTNHLCQDCDTALYRSEEGLSPCCPGASVTSLNLCAECSEHAEPDADLVNALLSQKGDRESFDGQLVFNPSLAEIATLAVVVLAFVAWAFV